MLASARRWGSTLGLGLALVAVATPAAAASMTLDRAFEFTRASGYGPTAAMVKASDGLWYGVAGSGGVNKDGVIFRVSADGHHEVLHAFEFGGNRGNQNADQFSALREGAGGLLYGTAIAGDKAHGGHGLLYRIGLDGQYTALHYFGPYGTPDGMRPMGPPVLAGDGNLYGVAHDGGAHGLGAIYRYSPASGAVTTVYSFSGFGADGSEPTSLTLGPDSALYGTTVYGPGRDLGGLFRYALDGTFTSLHTVPENRREGVFPGSLVTGPDGLLYGVAPGLVSGPKGNFQGLVFRMSITGDYSILAGFPAGGMAGIQPGPLSFDADGALLLTTFNGGRNDGGVTLRLTVGGQKEILHTFDRFDPKAPHFPLGGLGAVGDGRYIGTTSLGGPGAGQLGVVFTLSPR